MKHEMEYEMEDTWPLDMESRTDADVLKDAYPGHEVHESSQESNQRFATNTHPEGLDDGVDEHGTTITGPKPGQGSR